MFGSSEPRGVEHVVINGKRHQVFGCCWPNPRQDVDWLSKTVFVKSFVQKQMVPFSVYFSFWGVVQQIKKISQFICNSNILTIAICKVSACTRKIQIGTMYHPDLTLPKTSPKQIGFASLLKDIQASRVLFTSTKRMKHWQASTTNHPSSSFLSRTFINPQNHAVDLGEILWFFFFIELFFIECTWSPPLWKLTNEEMYGTVYFVIEYFLLFDITYSIAMLNSVLSRRPRC